MTSRLGVCYSCFLNPTKFRTYLYVWRASEFASKAFFCEQNAFPTFQVFTCFLSCSFLLIGLMPYSFFITTNNIFQIIMGNYLIFSSEMILVVIAIRKSFISYSINSFLCDPWSLSNSCQPICLQHMRLHRSLPRTLSCPAIHSSLEVYAINLSVVSVVLTFEL